MLGLFVCVNNAEINDIVLEVFYATYYVCQYGYFHCQGAYFGVNITGILRIFFFLFLTMQRRFVLNIVYVCEQC